MALPTDLTPQEKLHINLMKGIARSFSDTPMILKGGTALLLGYGLDRYSEDLDFDSNRGMRLENRIQKSATRHVTVKAIDLVKDTDTVSRYRLVYTSEFGEGRLKIETSFRDYNPDFSQMIDGIKIYDLPTLISQKLSALENRTRARDLYDVEFLAREYPKVFTTIQTDRLQSNLSDINSLEKRFNPAFENDSLLYNRDVTQIIIALNESVQHIRQEQ